MMFIAQQRLRQEVVRFSLVLTSWLHPTANVDYFLFLSVFNVLSPNLNQQMKWLCIVIAVACSIKSHRELSPNSDVCLCTMKHFVSFSVQSQPSFHLQLPTCLSVKITSSNYFLLPTIHPTFISFTYAHMPCRIMALTQFFCSFRYWLRTLRRKKAYNQVLRFPLKNLI